MSDSGSSGGSGVGFLALLTLLFIALKLTGFIEWSWWWVLSPIWLFILLLLGIAMAVLSKKK